MPPRRNALLRDVMIDDLQREIHQLQRRLTRLEQRKVERQQGMQQKRRSHHPTALSDKEDNSPTVPDPGPLWSSEPIWDSEPKWDGEPNWDDNPIQLPHQSQNDLEQDSHRSLMEEDEIYEKDLKPEDIVPDADAQHEDDDEIVIGPPRPSPPSSSEMLDVVEEEGDMIGPPRPPHDTWDDGSDSDLDDLPLNDKLQIPLSNEIMLKGHSRIVSALAVDHSGSRVFSGSYDYTVRMYDFQGMNSKLQSFRQLEPFEGHQVRSLSWSPTSNKFLCITGSAQAKMYDRHGLILGEFIKGDMYIRDLKNTKGHISGLTGGETTSNSGDESKEGEVAGVDRDRKSGRDEFYKSVITIGEEEDGKSVASNDSDGGMDDDAMFRMDAYHGQLLKEKKKLLVGADDMDIFEGISLKLLALEFLLKRNPDLRGKVVLIQIANPAWSIGKDVNVLQHAIEKDLDSAAWFDVPFEVENAVCEKGGTVRPLPWPSWRSEVLIKKVKALLPRENDAGA